MYVTALSIGDRFLHAAAERMNVIKGNKLIDCIVIHLEINWLSRNTESLFPFPTKSESEREGEHSQWSQFLIVFTNLWKSWSFAITNHEKKREGNLFKLICSLPL